MNTKSSKIFIQDFMNYVKSKDPEQAEFHQAVKEVVETFFDIIFELDEILEDTNIQIGDEENNDE